jgi:hypothetical protein
MHTTLGVTKGGGAYRDYLRVARPFFKWFNIGGSRGA